MFDIKFENHEVKDNGIFKLHYVNYHLDRDTKMYHLINWDFDAFSFPLGMNKEDGFKVLSFLTDYIEKTSKIPEASFKSVFFLNQVLDIERLEFKRLSREYNDEAVSLFTVGGDLKKFKKETKFYNKYFEWYIPKVKENEVEEIYVKLGKKFIKPVYVEDKAKTLKKSSRENF